MYLAIILHVTSVDEYNLSRCSEVLLSNVASAY